MGDIRIFFCYFDHEFSSGHKEFLDNPDDCFYPIPCSGINTVSDLLRIQAKCVAV